jgi:acyl dehydratase
MTVGTAEAGQVVEIVAVEDLKRTQIVQYAGASSDFNPLHTDEPYATQVAGYPSVFAHGMLTMGVISRVVTETWGVERLQELGGRFRAQVWPGDTLRATATVRAVEQGHALGSTLARIEIVGRNQRDDVVFDGYATVRLDD